MYACGKVLLHESNSDHSLPLFVTNNKNKWDWADQLEEYLGYQS